MVTYLFDIFVESKHFSEKDYFFRCRDLSLLDTFSQTNTKIFTFAPLSSTVIVKPNY